MLRLITGSLVTVSLFGSFGSAALGRSLQCNKQQTRCVTDTTSLTIGDRVGVFNGDGELVATGEVDAMRGERRAVLINKRHGAIRKGYDLALLETSAPDADLSTTYKIYRDPGKVAAGASFGYSSISIGEGSPAAEISGYGQWRRWGNMLIIGRGVYTKMESQVVHITELGYERLPLSMSAFSALGGAAYILRENKPISFRGEVALGATYISATVDGDAGLVGDADVNSNIKNGVAPSGRWSLGVMWNLADWHVHGDFAQSLVHQAFANTLAFGVSKDLK